MDRTERTRLRALYEGIALPLSSEPLGGTAIEIENAEGVYIGSVDIDDGPGFDASESTESHAALIVGAVNAMPSLLDAVAAAEALRPRDPHRTGHRCACCGREGAPEADGLCPWCSEAHATERERDSLRVALDLRNDTITAMRERATESVAACAAAERARDDAREDLARIGRLVECDSLVGVEIHAAVEHVVRHELDAARDAAERAERERDDARAEVETLRAEAVLLREQLAAATARLEFADAGLKKLADAGWELATDRDRLRAIIAGRTDAPTDAEIAAHYATGGWWRSFRHAYEMDHNGLRFTVGAQSHDYGSAHFVEVDRAQFARDGHVATWWPIDADGRPCAWPVTP